MPKRDYERLDKLRIAVRYLLDKDSLKRGHQSRLAEHFAVSRQRVHQVVTEERLGHPLPRGRSAPPTSASVEL